MTAVTDYQCGSPVSVFRPHSAPNPVPRTKANPMKRPLTSLLLQPWSTAISQTVNNKMAITANALSHMLIFLHHQLSMGMDLLKGLGSQRKVMLLLRHLPAAKHRCVGRVLFAYLAGTWEFLFAASGAATALLVSTWIEGAVVTCRVSTHTTPIFPLASRDSMVLVS
jgi:hypothetical protein